MTENKDVKVIQRDLPFVVTEAWGNLTVRNDRVIKLAFVVDRNRYDALLGSSAFPSFSNGISCIRG